MGAKNFTNQTPYAIAVTLTIRNGDIPGSEAGTQEFSLNPGHNQLYTYSQGTTNPYLDSVVAVVDSGGNIIASQQAVTIRSSVVDDALNTNNTVVFTLQNQSLIVSYSNN
ncbi:hypothetical protein [Hymenobacter defluvii]|uniref:hypothetical protein n=1 Tax=Hymenobacter defluvii TaxID=2054411 RepID=UPI001AAE2523|nr:hypothetical protein [Hymenobacter defluvii]